MASYEWSFEVLRSQINLKRYFFTPSTCGPVCAPTSDRVHANIFSLAATVWNSALKITHFQNQFGISGLQDYGRQAAWSHFVLFQFFSHFFSHFKRSLQVVSSCLGGCCNAVLLWSSRKMLSPDYPLAWGGQVMNCTVLNCFRYGWIVPLTCILRGGVIKC